VEGPAVSLGSKAFCFLSVVHRLRGPTGHETGFVARQGPIPSDATTAGTVHTERDPGCPISRSFFARYGIPLMLTASSCRRRAVLRIGLWYPTSREKRARYGTPFDLWRGEIQTFCTVDRAAVFLFLIRVFSQPARVRRSWPRSQPDCPDAGVPFSSNLGARSLGQKQTPVSFFWLTGALKSSPPPELILEENNNGHKPGWLHHPGYK
jgi:hypothetical protein